MKNFYSNLRYNFTISQIGFIFLLFTFLCSANANDKKQTEFQLSAAEWAQPKRAETVMQMPAIKNAINVLNSNSNSRLLIKYPGGEMGVLWASELKGWLISLGLESAIVKVSPGSSRAETIILRVVSGK